MFPCALAQNCTDFNMSVWFLQRNCFDFWVKQDHESENYPFLQAQNLYRFLPVCDFGNETILIIAHFGLAVNYAKNTLTLHHYFYYTSHYINVELGTVKSNF